MYSLPAGSLHRHYVQSSRGSLRVPYISIMYSLPPGPNTHIYQKFQYAKAVLVVVVTTTTTTANDDDNMKLTMITIKIKIDQLYLGYQSCIIVLLLCIVSLCRTRTICSDNILLDRTWTIYYIHIMYTRP